MLHSSPWLHDLVKDGGAWPEFGDRPRERNHNGGTALVIPRSYQCPWLDRVFPVLSPNRPMNRSTQ